MRTMHHVLEIVAPPEHVFHALTTTEGLASWWTTQVNGDAATVGAQVTFTFRGAFNPRMRITAIGRPERVEWEGVGGHDAWGATAIRFALAPTASGTLVRFWHDLGNDGDDHYGGANFIWGYYLDSLRLLCETGTGKPFPVEVAGARVGAS
jgi:uncharacterized protein YndB with AHSA1/START domain